MIDEPQPDIPGGAAIRRAAVALHVAAYERYGINAQVSINIHTRDVSLPGELYIISGSLLQVEDGPIRLSSATVAPPVTPQ